MVSEEIKTLQLVGQAAEFKFESKFEPLPVFWQSLHRLFQKVIESLEGKINCLHCLGAFYRQAQTQSVSKSAAVAAGHNLLA